MCVVSLNRLNRQAQAVSLDLSKNKIYIYTFVTFDCTLQVNVHTQLDFYIYLQMDNNKRSD